MPKRERHVDEELLQRFAANLRRLRSDAGYSQESFALQVGLHRTYISHVERASVNLSLGNAFRIAAELGVGLDELTS